MVTLQRQGILFCLLGPAGSGKTTLSTRLLEEFQGTLVSSISYTTRTPRPNEKHGEHYFFVSRDDFMNRVKKDEFFEWEETHGNLYGTPHKTLDNAVSSGVDLILDIDIRGAKTFTEKYAAHVVSIFLLPPSLEELKRRIETRGAATIDEVDTRLATSKEEYAMLLTPQVTAKGAFFEVDYCVLNDDLEEAYHTVRGIIQGERSRLSRLDKSFLSSLCGITE